MAKETRFIGVNPTDVESTIEMWSNFGWELVGAPQEIFNKDSHAELRGEDTYSVTTTTHYVRITFQRDKKMPHYAELVTLEKAFYSNPQKPIEPTEPTETEAYGVPKRVSIGFIIMAIGCLALSLAVKDTRILLFLFLAAGGIFAILTVVSILTYTERVNKYNEKNEAQKNEFETQMENYNTEKENHMANLKQYEEAIKIKAEAVDRAKALLE